MPRIEDIVGPTVAATGDAIEINFIIYIDPGYGGWRYRITDHFGGVNLDEALPEGWLIRKVLDNMWVGDFFKIYTLEGSGTQKETRYTYEGWPYTVDVEVVNRKIGEKSFFITNMSKILDKIPGVVVESPPVLSAEEINTLITGALKDVTAISFDLKTEIGEMKLPPITQQAPLPTIGKAPEVAPPSTELTVAKLQDMVTAKVEQLKKLIGKPGELPDIFIDFAFVHLKGGDETAWQACSFPNPFSEPPVIVPSVEFREGWFDSVAFPSPVIKVEEKTIDDFRTMFPEGKFEAPKFEFATQTVEEIKGKIDEMLKPLMFNPTEAAKKLGDKVREQAEAKLKGMFGDWKIWKLDLNRFRDIVIAALIAVVVIVALVTSPAMFLLILMVLGVIGGITVAIIKLINSVGSACFSAIQYLANLTTSVARAQHNYSRELGAQLSNFSYRSSNANLGAMNEFAKIHSNQAGTALNNAIPMLYGMSDLPQMKLPVCPIRNVTTKNFEILIPKEATAHIFIIGKVTSPLGGFMPRTMAQMAGMGILPEGLGKLIGR